MSLSGDATLRAAILDDESEYGVGVAIAHTDHLEFETGIDNLGDAIAAMLDLMATYSPLSELLAMADDMGSSPLITR